MKKYLIKNNKPYLFALIMLLTLTDVATIGVALVLNFVIDEVYAAIQTGEMAALVRCAWISVGFALLVGAVVFATQKMKAVNVKHIMTEVRGDLMKGIMEKSMVDFREQGSAEYITMLNQNLETFEENYLNNLMSIYESVVSIVLGLLVLVFINPVVAVISIAAMSIPSLIPMAFSKKLSDRQAEIMRRTSDYNGVVGDLLNGFEVIRTFRIADVMEKKHLRAASDMENEKAGLAGTMAVLYGVTNMAAVAVQLMIMTLAGAFAVKGIISIGSIIAVTQLSGEVINPAFELSAKMGQLRAVKPICEKMLQMIEDDESGIRKVKEADTVDKEEGKEKEKRGEIKAKSQEKRQTDSYEKRYIEMNDSLELKNISFSYGDSPVLRDMSASFKAGGKYAIMGKSGCGKSTILKLLAGYYDSYEGGILVDGCELERGREGLDVTLISQDVFLFNDTIRNNITLYGDFSQESIEEAVKQAGLDTVVAGEEHGLDTMVGENGEQFSGGERQRIAIARALLHHKKILLLDEATSALDAETADKVEKSILDLEGVMCIAVTHKMSDEVLVQYDETFLMEDGRLVRR